VKQKIDSGQWGWEGQQAATIQLGLQCQECRLWAVVARLLVS